MRTCDLADRYDSTMSNLKCLPFAAKVSASKSSEFPSISAHVEELLQAFPRLSIPLLPLTYVNTTFRQRVNRNNFI